MNRKSFLLGAILLIGFISTQAQQWLNLLPQNKTRQEITLKDHKKAFDSYWQPYNVKNGYYYENGIKKKAYGWKQFMRWYYDMQGKVNARTGAFPKQSAEAVYNAFMQSHPNMRSSTHQAAWVSLGTNSSSGGYAGIGRISAIAFHPTDNNTYWVGAPAGGVWRTTDNGNTWTCLTDGNQVLGVSSIIIPSDYATSQTIYIATGDRDTWDNTSIGVLKSTDGGATWNTTGLTFDLSQGRKVNKMLLDPNDNQTIIAATNNGVYKTTDGATTWNLIANNSFIDLEYKPNNFSTLYGSTTNGGIYVSTNGGTSWNSTFDNGRRIELAVSPANSNLVMAVVSNNQNGLFGVYKSTNSGTSFIQVLNGGTKNLLGYEADGSGSGGQGWYDLSLAVSRTDANIVLVGGVNTWKSANGGTSWDIVNHWSGYNTSAQTVHADKHVLEYRTNGDLFEGNDGGVYLSQDNGANWTDKSNGLVISQMYKLSVSAQESTKTITGLQDNGSKMLYNGNWYDVTGGDGMECLIDYTNSDIQYATYAQGVLYRTMDNWSSRTTITPQEGGQDVQGAWVTPYVMSPTDHNTLYAGYGAVWKTTDKGDTWTKLTVSGLGGNITSMAIAPSNASVLYVSEGDNLYKTTDGGANWTQVSLPSISGNITYIAIKNDNPNQLWITTSEYNNQGVFESTDGGASWANISNGLPSIPVYTIVQNKQVTNEVQLYVGTELGVYLKNGNGNWEEYNEGLPKVKCGELDIYYDNTTIANSRLRLASYGRGLWETPLAVDPNAVAINTTSASSITINSAVSGGNITSDGGTAITARGIVWGTSALPTLSDNVITDSGTGTGNFTANITGLTPNTTYYIRAYATNSNGTFYGNEVSFSTLSNLPTVITTPITSLTSNSAVLGGNITADGESSVTARGIVWGTATQPTLSDNVITDADAGMGSFTSTITGLSAYTTYYVRAYAVNANGISYGDEISFLTPCEAITTFPYEEGFEGSTFPPQCWVSYIGENGIGTVENWKQKNQGHTGSKCAYVNFENVDGGNAEDWLVTPPLTLPVGASLSFFQKQSYSDDYGTSYAIKISTISQMDRSSFVNLETYGETSFGTSYSKKEIDLSSYAGQTIYIAFVMTNDDGDEWFVDDFKIEGMPSVVSDFSANPTQICAGTSVTFTDASTNNPTTWSWDFGDGTAAVTEQNPTHVYATAGTYTVSLSASNAAGGDTKTMTDYITVVAPANAGTNGTLAVCEGTTPSETDLFNALEGTPQTGGTWSNEGLVYTYTVSGTAPCGNATATVTVTEQAPPNAGANGTLSVCQGTTPSEEDLFNALGGAPQTGGTWSNSGLVYTYTVTATAPCTENATATINVTEVASADAGTNGTLSVCEGATPSETDLFEALGGTPQTGGVWSNNGLIYTYTVTLSCGTASATVTVTEQAAPNAGTNGVLSVCQGTTPSESDLFDALEGTPQEGGSWSNEGLVYTYTVTATAPCTENATATVTVTEIASANAGTNGVLSVCQGTTPSEEDLFNALGGNPQTGGTWSNSGLVYTYTVTATAPCTENATATVTVTEVASADAGTNGTLSVCEGATPSETDLFNALGGTPQAGGTWSNEGLVYTYTVSATAPCENATATVTVTEQAAPNAGTNGTLSVCQGVQPSESDLFEALGGAPQTGGTWSNEGLVYTYTVNATAPCTENATATISVTETPNPVAQFTINSSEAPTVSFINTSTDADIYLWDLGDATTSTDMNVEHTYTQNDVYTISLKASNDCGESTYQDSVNISNVGIVALDKTLIKMYPNPANQFVTIDLGEDYNMVQSISVIDNLGKQLIELNTIDKPIVVLPTESLVSGVYFVNIVTNNNRVVLSLSVLKK